MPLQYFASRVALTPEKQERVGGKNVNSQYNECVSVSVWGHEPWETRSRLWCPVEWTRLATLTTVASHTQHCGYPLELSKVRKDRRLILSARKRPQVEPSPR